MTSEVESLKSNEFLRRRKLRLLQVREQSKSVAKKVRQRTSEEILKQVSKSNSQKQRDNLDLKNKFVKELQKYFIEGANNFGEGHKQATLVNEADVNNKSDLSKLRGKAAAVELRKKKQEKLDAQKKILDRKLQARDVANEISREKSSVTSKLCSKLSTVKSTSEAATQLPVDGKGQISKDNNSNEIGLENPQAIAHSDMATQCDAEETLKEWNPSIPSLPLPSDEDPKVSTTNFRTQKNKRLNLFTLSDDMPSSLRGGLSTTSNTYEKVKPSLTMVTEYLQARAMRLREPEPSTTSKKSVENLNEIRDTIIRSRSTRTEVSDKPSKISEQSLLKKPSVTMYDHSTRDTQNIPYSDMEHVTRDQNCEDDAFIQATRQNDIESSIAAQSNHENKNIGSIRSKVAMSKLNVEKEYKDTMEFLNTIHKDKAGNPVIRNAYKDEEQQQESHIRHQKKLERGYRKVEKEHKKHICKKLNHIKSKSSATKALEDEYIEDIEYSWMPVPESDDNLAIHTIPTTVKEPKSGNSVKFNKVDGYHEYRSRHKHTPPTKEPGNARNINRKVVEAVFVEDIHESSATTESDNVSSENVAPEPVRKVAVNQKHDNSDAERIIIYKIVESKKSKKDKTCVSPSKSSSIYQREETKLSATDCNAQQTNLHSDNRDAGNQVSLDHLNEGIYKSVAEKGSNMSTVLCNSQEKDKKIGDVPVGHKCKNAPLLWEVGAQPTTGSKTTEPCNCGQLSSCNSASSFKTADKAANVSAPDGGFIKLVDGDGQEAGKFYIGASGFLRDDAYEVVFQLRKKDCYKKVDKEKPVEAFNFNNKVDATEPPSVKICQDAKTKLDNKVASHLNNIDKIESPKQDGNANAIKLVLEESEKPEDVQKISNASSQSSQKQSTNSVDVNLVKPSITTCTQTSFSSPSERPAFVHMSSSASTSYMSPPEKILPKFIRNKRRRPDHCRKHEQCICQKCKFHDIASKQNEFARNLMTPPNTARSVNNKSDYSESECRNKKRKHRCRRTLKRKNVKNKNSFTSHHTALSNQAVWDNFMSQLKSETELQKTNRGTILKNKPELNPLIKTYVDHLLSLNRDSLKAIEVVNLECSSVSTPGSSIIATPHNLDKTNCHAEKKISLEQIKKYIEHQLVEKTQELEKKTVKSNLNGSKDCFQFKSVGTLPKKKQIHKVKSLNISKSLRKPVNSTTPPKEDIEKPCSLNQKNVIRTSSFKKPATDLRKLPVHKKLLETNKKTKLTKITELKSKFTLSPNKSVETMISSIPMLSDVKIPPINISPTETQPYKPIHNSTQTNQILKNDINFIKIAETKLENMEKIANLTEKCTTRLSNLAKVLEEVRKNKCTSYSHVSISDGASNSDQDFEKNTKSNDKMNTEITDPGYNRSSDSITSPELRSSSEHFDNFTDNLHIDKSHSNTKTLDKNGINQLILKGRAKPPPALANYGKYYVTPHELSTVVEVDSPMSLIIKKQSPYSSSEEITKNRDKEQNEISRKNKQIENPDLLQNEIPKSKEKEDSKIGMLDLNQFNKIMLQPFISIQDYAKDVNIVSVDEASNLDDFIIPKEGNGIVTDDVSSMHSDGSLPDVVSELLKRKLITEPFKFDSGSNENSTTISSDSTVSIFKKKSDKENRKTQLLMQNNEKVAVDSSDTISISSNPDLENAFKKLGMGWASSTLKKTKERLALSSSSNTSSSSLCQFKVKSFNQEIPAIVTDSISSVTNVSKKRLSDKSKNAEQQTVISNSMTVKEFLTTELSKKITFSRKPDRTGQTDEFLSLCETKIPEEFKESPTTQDQSQNGNNRARTSTPVQIFKSMTYRSSSNSNTSNGLFSNADDLSSVKGSNSIRNHSTSDKDDLTIPNYSLKMRKSPDNSKSD